MPAIKIHHTPTSTKPWDGPMCKANLKTGMDMEYYSQAFAWRDPEGDEANKSTYKFIHHDVASDGTPGAANIKGCQSGIGVLNGGMGGANIPDSDRRGVWNHLAAHLRDAKLEPAELNAVLPEIERRNIEIELRIENGDNKKSKIRGYAAVFNKLSENLGGFREQIAPGTFRKTIEKDDVRALFNHDANYVLGRNKAGTLTLAEDEKGLNIEIDPPETQYARDLQESIKRGDVSQMSFGFVVITDNWQFDKGKEAIRTLQEVRLFDVSPVTFPAYPQTSVKVREYLASIADEPDDPGALNRPDESLETVKRKIAIAEIN